MLGILVCWFMFLVPEQTAKDKRKNKETKRWAAKIGVEKNLCITCQGTIKSFND
uniref:hypothetical protein n=1 Tax=Segatella hominis TaxID=2518605 RepID=UPI00258E2E2B|nr:hypothetical protein [Prevotella sp.]